MLRGFTYRVQTFAPQVLNNTAETNYEMNFLKVYRMTINLKQENYTVRMVLTLPAQVLV